MEEHKSAAKAKRDKAKASASPPPAKKPKMAAGLSRTKSAPSTGKRGAAVLVQPENLFFTPRKQPSNRNPKLRAEDRMLQEAIIASLKNDDDPLTPVKAVTDDHLRLSAVYNPILLSQGRSAFTPLDVENLPSSIHSHGFSVLGDDEVALIKSTQEGHVRFMRSAKQAPIIAHLLGAPNLALIDGLMASGNIRQCEINQNFRLFDLMTLLSYRYTTDAVLTCYMHYLSSIYPNVYFMNPVVYKWVEDYDRTNMAVDEDILCHDYMVWPLNLGNNHWVVALTKTAPGSKIFFCDSLNGSDIDQKVQGIPENLIKAFRVLGRSMSPPQEWDENISVLLVPRQHKHNNDCGCCVNEIARAFAHDPENVLAGEIDVCFDSLTLRCTQAACLLKWLHHDVCK